MNCYLFRSVAYILIPSLIGVNPAWTGGMPILPLATMSNPFQVDALSPNLIFSERTSAFSARKEINHIIISVLGSSGDVHPMLAVGQILKNRGYRVTVLTNPEFEDEVVKKAGLAFAPLGTKELYQKAINHPDIYNGRKGITTLMKFLAPATRETYEWIAKNATVGEALLFTNRFVFGAKVAQEKLSIPLVLGELGASHLWSCIAPPQISDFPLLQHLPGFGRRLLYWILDRYFLDPLIAFDINRVRNELLLTIQVSRVFSRYLLKTDMMIGLFSEEFAKPQPDWPEIELTGFPFYRPDLEPAAALTPELEAFLDNGPKPIVFTGGSANPRVDSSFEAALKACELGNFRAVFVGPLDKMPAHLPSTVLAVTSAPFHLLFNRVQAVVHPGMMGTSAEAMLAGVPQLLWPLAFDQPDNADRLKQMGVAMVLDKKAYRTGWIEQGVEMLLIKPWAGHFLNHLGSSLVLQGSESRGRLIAKALDTLLADSSIAQRCIDVSNQMKRAIPGDVQAARHIEAFSHLIQESNGKPPQSIAPLTTNKVVPHTRESYSYERKVVFITGASSGIGKALARKYARNGATVVITARRKELLEALAEEINQEGFHALPIVCDVTDYKAVERAVQQTINTFGGIDVVVANAGRNAPGVLTEVPLGQIKATLDVNIWGVLLTVMAALPSLIERKGRVALMGSVLGFTALQEHPIYSMTKYALRGFADGIYLWLKRRGVSVTYIAPSYVADTEFQQTDPWTGIKDPERPDPSPPGLRTPIDEAARLMFLGIDARKRELIISGHGNLMVWMSRMLSWAVLEIVDFIIQRQNHRPPPPPTAGSGGEYSLKQGPPGKKSQRAAFRIRLEESA